MSKVLAISPHLDDAVLSAGDLIAHHPGTTVITVFAGMPPANSQISEWDRACGFASAQDSLAARYREDDAALALLRARPLRLEHLDRQYGVACSTAAILGELESLVWEYRPAVIAFPLGLHHPDHLTIAKIMLKLRDSAAEEPIEWIAWTDVPYRALPGVVESRMTQLRADRDVYPWMTPVPRCVGKLAAVARYRSQLAGLAADAVLDLDDTAHPEQYWSIAPHR